MRWREVKVGLNGIKNWNIILDRKCNFGGKGLTVQTRYKKIGDYFMQPYTI